ncbi:MAG: hypothetical protein CMH70_05255 [Nitrosomonadaceae bacterium]|nr:hypothetical protein [Nitrosomonadaceae bacterium]|tara:strand:- start:1625 stop:2818 length:1194 start_codon:yes stop_codon:yes gene_type:complete
MNIGIYLENYRAGGLDRIIIDTINHWPNPTDSFTIFCNQEHEGLEWIIESVDAQVEFVTYEDPKFWEKLPSCSEGSLSRSILVAWYIVIGCYVMMPFQIFKLRRIFKKSEIEAIFVHNGGWPAARSSRSAALAASMEGIKNVVLVIHGQVNQNNTFFALQERILEKILSSHCQVVTVSKAAAESLSKFTKLPKALVIYNGIRNITRLEALKPYNDILQKEDYRILAVGTLNSHRGHDVLFEVIKLVINEVPSIKLYIAGTGSKIEVNQLKALIQKLGVGDNVFLLGFRKDIPNLMGNCDVFINPVQKFESFGLSAVEAMAMGKPVISSNIGGIPEVIIDGVTGLLAEPKDTEKFARHLIALYRNINLRKKLGANGLKRYTVFFKAELMSANYAGLLL